MSILTDSKSETTPNQHDAWLKIGATADFAGFSIRTVYHEISRGNFPRPVQLSARRVAWRKSDLEAWRAKKVAERDVVA